MSASAAAHAHLATVQAVNALHQTGWASLPGFVSPAERQALDRDLDALIAGEAPAQTLRYTQEIGGGQTRLTRVECIWEHLPSLQAFGLGDRLEALAAQCLGCQPQLFKDKLNLRYPGDAGYAPHQDTAAGWTEFGDAFVSIFLALHSSCPQNGGFRVVPSAHRIGRLPNEAGRMSEAAFNALAPVEVTLEPGGLLLLDGEAPHLTGPNRTGRVSRHLIFTFVRTAQDDVRTLYYETKRGAFGAQPGEAMSFRVFKFEPSRGG
jgi:ectoine hydroxylase-related dioxygenase (phytanoyl-CoA dioxygenase family)